MTANLLSVLALLAVVILPVVENRTAFKRQVVQPTAERTGSFYRGAVESPPQIAQKSGPGFQRSSVEYRPNPDFRPRHLLGLKDFNSGVFLSQFYYPSLHVDQWRKEYPIYAPIVVLPTYVDNNLVIQKGYFTWKN
jgi:hypothetical protein